MSAAPSDRRYLDSHEWHRSEGELVTLGLSKFAIDELTDVTFVELPEVGKEVEAGQAIGEIESVKATSEIYTGVGGTIAEVNQAVQDDPGLINADPWEKGWLVKIEPNDPDDLEQLMTQEDYEKKYPSA
ncbi:MAG: glycine cleavage system protein GcvH [Phycisphaeraceae bacterium]